MRDADIEGAPLHGADLPESDETPARDGRLEEIRRRAIARQRDVAPGARSLDAGAAARAPAAGLAADFVNDVTQIYLNEIGRHALLPPEEELALTRARRAPATSPRGRR